MKKGCLGCRRQGTEIVYKGVRFVRCGTLFPTPGGARLDTVDRHGGRVRYWRSDGCNEHLHDARFVG